MKHLLSLILFFLFFGPVYSQENILQDPLAPAHVKKGLDAIYSFDFKEGERQIQALKRNFPDHPAVYFMEGLKIYWENFPLSPENENTPRFESSMEKCIEISVERLKKDENDLEAIFFDLFGRAFYIMFWADNGKPSKVLSNLNTLYKHTIEGFELMHTFNEFYFTSGLYNYYIEAYPEKHPVYKPIVSIFRDGNKSLGLEQLKYCAENSIFLRVEAKFFISLLYLNYENDLDSAARYAAQLYNEFPNNPFYAGEYLEILIYNKKYFFAPIILKRLKEQDNEFAQMQYQLFNAMYLEKNDKNYELAKKYYEMAVESSEKFGYFTENYTAIAYMGLGRYFSRKGDESLSGKYFRTASKLTRYDYILDDR